MIFKNSSVRRDLKKLKPAPKRSGVAHSAFPTRSLRLAPKSKIDNRRSEMSSASPCLGGQSPSAFNIRNSKLPSTSASSASSRCTPLPPFFFMFPHVAMSLRRHVASPPVHTVHERSRYFYGGEGHPFVFIGVYSWFALRRSLNRQPSTLNGLLAETHGKHSRTQSKHRSNPEEKHSKRQ